MIINEVLTLILSRKIWRIDKKTDNKIEEYPSVTLAAKWVFDKKLTTVEEFNGGKNLTSAISKAAIGKIGKSAYGYKWKYSDAYDNKYENEIWKEIPSIIVNGATDYKISNYGRMKSNKNRLSEGKLDTGGYLKVHI